MQIVHDGKLLQLHALLVICGKSFAIALPVQFVTLSYVRTHACIAIGISMEELHI